MDYGNLRLFMEKLKSTNQTITDNRYLIILAHMLSQSGILHWLELPSNSEPNCMLSQMQTERLLGCLLDIASHADAADRDSRIRWQRKGELLLEWHPLPPEDSSCTEHLIQQGMLLEKSGLPFLLSLDRSINLEAEKHSPLRATLLGCLFEWRHRLALNKKKFEAWQTSGSSALTT